MKALEESVAQSFAPLKYLWNEFPVKALHCWQGENYIIIYLKKKIDNQSSVMVREFKEILHGTIRYW